jgi:GxxExxY protein
MAADKRDERTYRIIGAAMEAHHVLGPGFLESVYQQALAVELTMRGIHFAREVPLSIHYKGHVLSTPFRADFLCLDEVIVELKAKEKLHGSDEAQVINYLKGSNRDLTCSSTSARHGSSTGVS